MVHSTPVGARGRLIPARNIKKTSEKQQELVRDENANISAEKKLGAAEVVVLRKRWQSLDTGNGGEDQQTGNGMIVCLLQQGLTLREIRAVLGCGKNRILRIRRELRDPSLKKKRKSQSTTLLRKNKRRKSNATCEHTRPNMGLAVAIDGNASIS